MIGLMAFENLKRCGQLYIIFILLFILTFQYSRIATLRISLERSNNILDFQNTAILHWKNASELQEQEAKHNLLAAAKIRAVNASEVEELLNAKISDQCEGAKEWAIEQAQKLS